MSKHQQTCIMPIVLAKDEWNRIVKWTDENKEDPEAIRRRDYINFLNQKSAEMTKTWPNSLENVSKRNEELRRQRAETAENANMKFYKRYLKRKKQERECMMHSARDTIFKNKDAPKLLLGAVVETVVLKEREEQLKFKETMMEYEREQKRLNDEDILRRAKEWNELMETRKKRRFEVNKAHQREIVEQIHEIEERKRKEFEEELRLQKLDNINGTKEMEAIKKFEQDFKEKERQRIWQDNTQSLKETQHSRDEQAMRNKMDDELLQVLNKSQARIVRKRKEVEQAIRDEKLRVLNMIASKLATGTEARDAAEQASLDKAVAEKNAQIEARHKADMEKKERFKQEKIEQRQQFLRDEEQKLHEEHTRKQWDIMNRFKNQEIYKEYKENQRKEKERKTKEYREDILKLWKECDDRNAKTAADTRYFYGELTKQKFREADNKVLAHAAELLEEAKLHGRPTMPIHKAIDRYCKLYRLYPMPDLPKSMKEHFTKYAPWDGSSKDPGYRLPDAPPAAPDMLDEVDDDDEPATATGKRDGLNELPVLPEPKSSPKQKEKPKPPKEENIQDYKRQGRANGLQQKKPTPTPPPPDIVLPPITVVTYPCKQAGIVTNVPLRKDECRCVMMGEI